MRDLISKANGQGRGDMSARFGINWARSLVRRADQGLPVNRDELKVARRLLAGLRRTDATDDTNPIQGTP